jgi:spermidine synthase
MRPWQVLESVNTKEGVLELRRRGERDFLMTIAGRVLMTSQHHRSEDVLADVSCAALAHKPRPRILLGGLGMGYTLRAALEQLPPKAVITVVELNQKVVDWNHGPIGPLARLPLRDERVRVVVADVAHVITRARAGCYDAILFDLYEGPRTAANRDWHPLYGSEALKRTRSALGPDGIFAVWSEDPDPPFEERLKKSGFTVKRHRCGKGGSIHVVYLAEACALPQDRQNRMDRTDRARPESEPPSRTRLSPAPKRRAQR